MNILATAGAVLWVFSASSSAHCSTKTKVSPDWCSEYSWQPGSSCTSSTAVVRMSRTVSTDSGLTVRVATTTTGMLGPPGNRMGDGLTSISGCHPTQHRGDRSGHWAGSRIPVWRVVQMMSFATRLAAWLARPSPAPEPERAGQRPLREVGPDVRDQQPPRKQGAQARQAAQPVAAGRRRADLRPGRAGDLADGGQGHRRHGAVDRAGPRHRAGPSPRRNRAGAAGSCRRHRREFVVRRRPPGRRVGRLGAADLHRLGCPGAAGGHRRGRGAC